MGEQIKQQIAYTNSDFDLRSILLLDKYISGTEGPTGTYESHRITIGQLIADINSNQNYVPVTVSQLRNLRDTNSLMPSTMYKITDFTTIYDQPDYSDKTTPKSTITTKTSSPETLLVFATGLSTISPIAFSVEYPTDIIKYSLDYTLPINTATPTKGRIYYREDEYGNKCNYDFRTVLFRRYGSTKNFWDNGGTMNEYLTFQSTYSSNDFTGRNLDSEPYDFDLPNIVCFDVAIGNKINGSINNVTFNNGFVGNTIMYKIWFTEIGGFCYNNYFYSCFQNYIGGTVEHNKINTFSNNSIIGNFNENEIYSFNNNTISGYILTNRGHDYSNNNLVTMQGNYFYRFYYNHFSSSVSFNSFNGEVDTNTGNIFNNSTGFGFSNNTLGTNFKNNNIKTSISSIDFSSATHVQNEYSCDIIERSDLSNVLSYVNGSNVLTFTSITA